jgi:ligand-binding sensor domain-containing protein
MTLFTSPDGGNNWINRPITSVNGCGNAIAINKSNDSIIYVGGKKQGKGVLFKTINEGASWQEITGKISGIIYDVAVDPVSPKRVYAGTSYGFFKSQNSGSAWKKIASFDVRCIEINSASPNEIYAGGEDGVFYSNNFGKTWSKWNDGLVVKNVLCIGVDVVNKILYAGSKGGGIYKRYL